MLHADVHVRNYCGVKIISNGTKRHDVKEVLVLVQLHIKNLVVNSRKLLIKIKMHVRHYNFKTNLHDGDQMARVQYKYHLPGGKFKS